MVFRANGEDTTCLACGQQTNATANQECGICQRDSEQNYKEEENVAKNDRAKSPGPKVPGDSSYYHSVRHRFLCKEVR